MSKFITVNQYMVDRAGNRYDFYDGTMSVNIKNIVDIYISAYQSDKYLVRLTLVNGKDFSIFLPGTPYANMADAITAKNNFEQSLEGGNS